MQREIECMQQLRLTKIIFVRIIIAEAKGSTPRKAGTSMLVWINLLGKIEIFGSIGGGYLEEKAIEMGLLSIQKLYPKVLSQSFILGVEFDQCCGGTLELIWERFEGKDDLDWIHLIKVSEINNYKILNLQTGENLLLNAAQFKQSYSINFPPRSGSKPDVGFILQEGTSLFYERITTARSEIWLFGAGHVAKKLLKILPDLDFEVRCFDTRKTILGQTVEDYSAKYPLVQFVFEADYSAQLANASPETYYLVMTHSHQLDFLICQQVLQANQFLFLGLIGSKTKSVRFMRRLHEHGVRDSLIQQLICPIGKRINDSNNPAVIALEIATQLLEFQENNKHHPVYAVPKDISRIFEVPIQGEGFSL